MKKWNNPEFKDLSICETKQNPGQLCETPNPGGVCHQNKCIYWDSKNSGGGVSGTCGKLIDSAI